jgi:N-acetyl-gamma-glutamyl-phosphate/LysW-gamma-L-alpha-aminoadipyl-6-phosphate reductase
MAGKIRCSIVGGSGYAGGDLLRLLLTHPNAEVREVTSERFVGKYVHALHPNLRKQTLLKFVSQEELQPCDLLFLCLPHGSAMGKIDRFAGLAPKIIDLSADFRLKNAGDYDVWYGHRHERPELLPKFAYGICELHREEIRGAKWVSSAGCNATAVILGLYPLFKNGLADLERTVVEVKAGSSEGGNSATEASHHPERAGCVRSYRPTGHRHVAEMLQELGFGKDIHIHFSATSIDMVRGILATCHVFLNRDMDEKTIWKLYREAYGGEPFIRIVKEREGNYRYPEPKLLSGTNFCDIGFEKDSRSNRVVVVSAIDNLMKGAAGQAVQAFNIMHGFDEKTGLEFAGLHPV